MVALLIEALAPRLLEVQHEDKAKNLQISEESQYEELALGKKMRLN